jgi:hypothetical protein
LGCLVARARSRVNAAHGGERGAQGKLVDFLQVLRAQRGPERVEARGVLRRL